MQREERAILVSGVWIRARKMLKKKLYIVLRWYWTDQEVGVRWQSFKTSEEAAALTLSVDCVHVVFERGGLRPD